MAHLPLDEYLRTLPLGLTFTAAYLTDEAGHPLLLRSTWDPDEWQLPGGNFDHADLAAGPWESVRRETREETGLVLPEPQPPLLAMAYFPPAGGWPWKTGWIFDGGTLTEAQIASITLDPTEHTEWHIRPLARWRETVKPRRMALIDAAAEARRTGRTAVLDRAAEPA